MLGLSDRGAIRNLLGLLLAGDAQAALAAVREQHDLGVEPAALIRGLLESVHGITRAKVGGAQDPAQSVEEREAYAEWAGRLSHAVIHRLWQLLLKGLGEVNTAPLPLEAAEMALLRVIHASELPDPGALLDRLQSGAPLPAPASPAPVVPPQDTLGALPASFADLVNYLSANGKAHIAQQLHDYVRLVRYAPPELAIQLGRPLSGDFVRDLSTALKSATGTQWKVEVAEGESEPSLLDQEKAGAERLRQSVLEQPVVAAAFQAFPDAELTGYRLDEPRSS
jgi:DNA polymerase-3 subunit gamma/tau